MPDKLRVVGVPGANKILVAAIENTTGGLPTPSE